MDKAFFHRSGPGQKGAVLVEFAILIPFLLLLLGGVTEIGYLYSQWDTLHKSVHRAARYIADPQISRPNGIKIPLNPLDLANLSTIADNLVIYGSIANTGHPLIPEGDTKITVDDPAIVSVNGVSNHIRLTAHYQHQFIMGNLINTMCRMVGGGDCFGINANNEYTLHASSVMRVEGG